MTIEFRSESTVEVIQQMGSDEMICMAARVSTGKDRDKQEGVEGLIKYLVENRHGSPFEHGGLTLRIEAPIFVFREFHRHRIGWSYNETSARYRQLDPVFYLPPEHRPLVQEGSSAHPKLVAGKPEDHAVVVQDLTYSYKVAWMQYQDLLDQGVAKEVARSCLPVGIFSSMYATANPRSLMNFMDLRLAENAQYEIRMVAQKIEDAFSKYWPLTHSAWQKNAYRAP